MNLRADALQIVGDNVGAGAGRWGSLGLPGPILPPPPSDRCLHCHYLVLSLPMDIYDAINTIGSLGERNAVTIAPCYNTDASGALQMLNYLHPPSRRQFNDK